jgi:O-antigen/teichoic acid export membrane protein
VSTGHLPPAPAAEPPGRGDGIVRNAFHALTYQLITAGFTAVLTLFLVRELAPRQYGMFALAMAVAGLLEIPSDLGISSAAARFVAAGVDDRARVISVTAAALRLKLVVSGIVTLGLMAAASVIAAAYGEPGLTWPLRGVALALFGQSLFQFYLYSFIARRRVSVNSRLVAAESAMETAASVALVLAGGGAAGAAFGRAAGFLFGAAVATFAIWRSLGRGAIDMHTRQPPEVRRSILSYAWAVAVVDISWTAFTQVDALLIGGILTTAAVGVFQAPMRLLVFLSYPSAAIAVAVAPRLSDGPGEMSGGERLMRACRLIVLVQAVLIAPLVVWPGPIVALVLGAPYHHSASVLRAIAPYAFLLGLAPLVSTGLDYLGEARRRIPVVVGALVLNLVIDVILIPRVGVVGGAIGSDVAFAVYVPAHLVICARMLDTNLWPLMITVARAGLAAAAMAGVLWLFGTSDVPVARLVLGAVAGTVSYVAVLVLVNEVTVREVEYAAGAARRAAARVRRRAA